ncbi:MAG: hypothetical protein ABR537_08185 [Gemmatimonadales bacterium]
MPNLAMLLPLLALQSQQLTAAELSIGGAAAMARRTFAGAEVGLAHRPSSDTRIAAAFAGGELAGRTAARAQVTLQLMINPFARTGVGLYGGVGAAFLARRGSPGQGFLAVLLGIERAPGRRHSGYLELGLAGGMRAAVGWRVRWFPSWWRGRGG